MNSAATDRFGFLPLNRSVVFDGGQIEPVNDLAGKIDEIKQATHEDRHLYPPEDRTAGRPAFLYQLPMPTSHVLTVDALSTGGDLRSGDGAFLMYFLGHLFCYRLQFEGWWFDGRLPMHGRRWSVLLESKEGRLVSDAYRLWRDWPKKERTRLTNLLYMHIRSFSYEWDWERFAVRYMVFDGCYRMARKLNLLPKGKEPGHGDRLAAMFSKAGMPTDATAVSEIVKLRNDLFHEVLWDEGQPGVGSRVGIKHADDLWRINDRLLFFLAGYKGDYLKVKWWDIGQALI